MRLFIALDISEEIRHKLATLVEGLRGLAPDVRWVAPESLHVTLKFLGETDKLEAIQQALAQVKAEPFEVSLRGTGFFPTATNARVLWVGLEAPEALAQLARNVDAAMTPLGFEREGRAFSPHLTLARSGSGAPRHRPGDALNRRFQRVQEQLQTMPPADFGTMSAREFFLYESQLSPQGARYTKLSHYPLGEH